MATDQMEYPGCQLSTSFIHSNSTSIHDMQVQDDSLLFRERKGSTARSRLTPRSGPLRPRRSDCARTQSRTPSSQVSQSLIAVNYSLQTNISNLYSRRRIFSFHKSHFSVQVYGDMLSLKGASNFKCPSYFA